MGQMVYRSMLEESGKDGRMRELEEELKRTDAGRKFLEEAEPCEDVTGHWFVDERPEGDREIICSNCEQPIFKYHKLDFDYRPNYCPNCGAKMREEE